MNSEKLIISKCKIPIEWDPSQKAYLYTGNECVHIEKLSIMDTFGKQVYWVDMRSNMVGLWIDLKSFAGFFNVFVHPDEKRLNKFIFHGIDNGKLTQENFEEAIRDRITESAREGLAIFVLKYKKLSYMDAHLSELSKELMSRFTRDLNTLGIIVEGVNCVQIKEKNPSRFEILQSHEALNHKTRDMTKESKSQTKEQMALVVMDKQVVSFGTYPFWYDGLIKELEWLVLAERGKEVLIITKEGIDCISDVVNSPENINEWLYEVFLRQVCPNNLYAKTPFLLDIGEVKMYFPKQEDRVLKPTAYTAKKTGEAGAGKCWWWLKGENQHIGYAPCVGTDGYIHENGHSMTDKKMVLRPAMWINKNDVKYK